MAQKSEPKSTPGAPGFRFIRESGGILEYELLANGLKVLVMEDHSAPVATVMLTYLVGSRHETQRFRGGAHLLEHMMFKGTPRYLKEKGNSIASTLQRTGALLNASTWKDGTNYYESLPADQLELALDIEADRMRNSLMRAEDLKSEMPVVQSEFDRLENSPLVALDLAVWDRAFTDHTYHFPIIGIRADLDTMPAESLKDFYNQYYWPNNAVLAVIGDFEAGEVLGLIGKKFSSVPASPASVAAPAQKEPEQKEPRFVRVDREDKLEMVFLAHKIPEATHPDTVTLDVLAFILSQGKTSRLYRSLVDRGLAIEVYTEHAKTYDPGLFYSEVILTPETRHADAEAIVLAVYEQIRQQGITPDELRRAKNQLHAQVAYSRDGSYSLADQLSRAIASGDWTFFSIYLDKLEAVSAADIQRVATQYLVTERLTRGQLVSKDPAIAAGKVRAATLEPAKPLADIEEEKNLPLVPEKAPAPELVPGTLFAARIHKTKIHGIEVRSIETDVRDVVSIVGSFEGAGQTYGADSAVASMTVSMLDEGTVRRDKFEIARLLENRGTSISFQIDAERVGFQARCLRKDVPILVGLIAEQLREPRFDPAEFEKQKIQQKVLIEQDKFNTATVAQNALSQILYPPKHPNYEPPFVKQLEDIDRLTIEDVRRFHREHYGPRRMTMVAAGDVDIPSFEKAIEGAFAGWPKPKAMESIPKSVALQPDAVKRTLYLPDKVKVDVFFAHALPLTRLDPDYLPVFVANAILGGDFSARLTNTVRDEQGLTYSIHSEIHGVDRDIHGDWQINIILNNKLLEKGIAATREQIEKWAREGIVDAELQDKRQTLVGRFKVSLSTTSGLAHRILRFEELGLGAEYLDQYPRDIEAVTLEQTNQAIRRYYHPEQLHLVISGTVREPKSQTSSV